MRKELTVAERLIVAVDFRPPPGKGRMWARDQALGFIEKISETGVILKAESLLRALGYDFADIIHASGLRLFADLKLNSIRDTMRTDGELLREASPELLTAMCSMGLDAMKALKSALPATEVLGVTFLTDLDDKDAEEIHKMDTAMGAVEMLALRAKAAHFDGLISSPHEIGMLREMIGYSMTINTPGIRPLWSKVEGDDQKRTMIPYGAIKAGADRIVVGRPITWADNPRDAIMRTLEEIERALAHH